jgi:DNA-binding FadR family transcriptional regulator
MKRPRNDTVVRRIANQLREEAFLGEHDALLGSEDELVERYGVSRPTFRLAAKLLEQSQLLKIKRGVKGGYFIQRPTSGAVAHMTAIYLQSRHATAQHLVATTGPLYAVTGRLAAQNLDAEGEQRLRTFVEHERETLDLPMTLSEYMASEHAFGDMFRALSGNAVASLFIEIIFSLAEFQTGVARAWEEGLIEQSRRLRLRVAEAILQRDAELAEVAARSWSATVVAWFAPEPEKGPDGNPVGASDTTSAQTPRVA